MDVSVVYRVTWDVERFQVLLYDVPEESMEPDLWMFDGTPRARSWTPLPVYADAPRLERPDIWCLAGAAVIVVPQSVGQELDSHLWATGELLALESRDFDEPLLLLNITRDVDCVDRGASTFDDALTMSLSFHPDRLPESGLFKVPECDTTEVLYLERDSDGDPLRRRLAESGLRGPQFEPIWSSETGATKVDFFAGVRRR